MIGKADHILPLNDVEADVSTHRPAEAVSIVICELKTRENITGDILSYLTQLG